MSRYHETLTVRLTEDQKYKVLKASDQAGVSPAQFGRSMVVRAAENELQSKIEYSPFRALTIMVATAFRVQVATAEKLLKDRLDEGEFSELLVKARDTALDDLRKLRLDDAKILHRQIDQLFEVIAIKI
ncbi:hypothetical protein [Kordiimonas marina]|uniref:hypothetical protein n=1 Tax=Kordiimonas marina TaxID=2872312 RepID=UPI001FF2D700|nr:hypothetical protein [Kordiimonas marina]MCJ9428071.1 hypothetical protein [Kordiimonas marina]